MEAELEDVKRQPGRVRRFMSKSGGIGVAAQGHTVELRAGKEIWRMPQTRQGQRHGAAAVSVRRHRRLRRGNRRVSLGQRAAPDQGLRSLHRQGAPGQARQGGNRLLDTQAGGQRIMGAGSAEIALNGGVRGSWPSGIQADRHACRSPPPHPLVMDAKLPIGILVAISQGRCLL